MPWYAAHVLMRMRYRQGPEEPHYLMENIVLLEAGTLADAREAARRHGLEDSNEDDPTFTCDDRPAYWEFAGVRMIMDCQDPDVPPGSGTEISYLEYRAMSSSDVERLLSGGEVSVELGS